MGKQTYTIAYLIDSLSYGGAERQLGLLVRSLPSTFTPVVISMSGDVEPFGPELAAGGVEVVAIERRGGVEIRRLLDAMRVIRSRGADVVHGFLDAANAYAFASARALRRPVVLSLRNEVLRLAGARRAVLCWMLRRADRVLVNSKAGADLLRGRVGVRDDRVLYLPNWIDPYALGGARRVPEPDAPPVVGFVGRFARQKRVDLLVDAFSELLKTVPEATLILMGDGGEREDVARRVEGLRIDSRVEFISANPRVGDTLKRLHVFVLTSAFEGLPNAAIEALSMGIPIVSTDVGDLREIVVEGKTGVFFDSDRPEMMAGTIARAIRDRDLLENAVRFGPTIVEEKFSIRRSVERMAEVYVSLAGR